MLTDSLLFRDVWEKISGRNLRTEALSAFVRFLEKRLGCEIIYDALRLPLGKPELVVLTELAKKLKTAGIIQSYFPLSAIPDEPPVTQWHAIFRAGNESRAKGSALYGDDRAALTIALAEAVERHIWFERIDHLKSSRTATAEEISRRRLSFLPERFAGFSARQRNADRHLILGNKTYEWIIGRTILEDRLVYIPQQIVSGSRSVKTARKTGGEPVIRHSTTCGLATWPTREGAILRGALELIERDAYMIMWLNQISPPLLSTDYLGARRPSFAKLVESCARYRLRAHVVRMPTDAPTYALMAVLEDETGNIPRLSFGLRAGPDAAKAAEGALLEALRARYGFRTSNSATAKKEVTRAEDVGHYDRIFYWTNGDRFKKLRFLLSGPMQAEQEELWEYDSDERHLLRISSWTSDREYGFASVSFTYSPANLAPLHIEFAVIPELQPIYFSEKYPHIGGTRLVEIPRLLGYSPLKTPYLDNPHPFA